ncbi:MAG: hypothetical protein M0R30_11175 [Methanoregula sp.]|jgi:hypothetical protein|uniref:hypothetical protein n=1 Tax=Methanoregula sp. TaxID=2052170 RepID=UPI0025D4AB0E|nr:hypothetical protein [Methanoregula sp.]MCK9632188.1 hypothetical protein [Methanoregula sp.]
MDEIEKGFEALMKKIEKSHENEKALTVQLKENDANLLKKMAVSSLSVVKIVGLNMLKMGKQDTKGEIYDPAYYPQKMIILGKSEPVAFRPDNPSKTVTDQFCVLSSEGDFFELMYSFDGFLTDSYLNPIDARKALDQYGYDVMFMLYRAMKDYLQGEEKLLDSLETVIGYVFAKKA